MPPSKKRFIDSSDSSEHFAKGARTDGGRRGILAPVGDGRGAGALAMAISPAATRTGSSGGSVTRVAGRRTDARKKQYMQNMAVLNYQTYKYMKGKLELGDIPSDALFTGVAENYILRANEAHRRHNRNYGDIVVFGSGDCGQLGCGEAITESRRPRILVNLRGKEINMLASGGLHSLALTQTGLVYSWGCNDEGSLGWFVTEEKDDGALPSEITGFFPSQYGPNGRTNDMLDSNGQIIPFEQRKEAIITQIDAGETQSLALSTTGDVYMWGAYKDNEGRGFRNMPAKDDTRKPTGDKDMTKLEEDDNPDFFKPPRGNQDWPSHMVEIPGKAKDISAGASFNAVLLEDDTIVTWGMGECGELARPVPNLTKKTPTKVILEEFLKPKPPVWDQPTLKRSVDLLSCGGYHILVVAREQGVRNVYSSGLNQYGQLGLGDLKNREKLTKIKFFEDMDVTIAEGGLQFSCFVDKTGKELYTCGRGDYGQLGITAEEPDAGYLESLPCRTPLVYNPSGTVSNPKENFIKVEDINEDEQPEIEQVSCGSTHVLVLTKGGDAYSWGFGTSGACGQGKSEEDVLLPKKLNPTIKNAQGVATQYKMQYVSGGGQHSTAIVSTRSTGFASA